MPGIGFYAPMKPPDDPVPSGDRTMARALITALGGLGLGEVRVISKLRSRDGRGDFAAQDRIFREAEAEAERLSPLERPSLWLTYHSYYKAPDLLGPVLSAKWGIPYVLVEATRAAKRLSGSYARFAMAAERACDTARVIFYPTEQDREALERNRPEDQRIFRLRPFLARESLDAWAPRRTRDRLRLLACGMFREGDKLASYAALASALDRVRHPGWELVVAGDGPAREHVLRILAPFGGRVAFLGMLGETAMREEFRQADLFVWPGVGEAFGMVYLEAQAEGCPVIAEDRPGVRDVVREGGWLVTPGNPAALAGLIDRLARDPAERLDRGRRGHAGIVADHLLDSARATLAAGLKPLMGESL